MKKILIILSALFITSCADVMVTNSSFDANEVSWFLEEGTGTLKGSAFLQRRDGMLVTCAGNSVNIIPVGTYSSERISNIYGNLVSGRTTFNMFNARVDEPNQQYLTTYNKNKICDVDGKFSFKNLAAGSYFVTTSVAWSVIDYSTEGGYLMKRVVVNDDEISEIVLN